MAGDDAESGEEPARGASLPRESLEEEALQTQKLELVGRLAKGIAHDFNNLLTAIGSALELARLDPGSREMHLDDAADAVARAAHLTRQLLTFAKKRQVELVPLSPRPCFERTAGLLRHLLAETLVIETHFAPDLGSVRADAVLLEQMLVALALNAAEAMSPGGKLTISARNLTLRGEEEIAAGDYVELVVSDTRTFPAADFSGILEPSRDEAGAARGLPTVRDMIEELGGQIHVSSSEAGGALVTVLFPRLAEGWKTGPTASLARRDRRATTVLAVEDNPMVRRVLEHVLVAHGYAVLLAANASVALSLANEHPGTVHAVVTDVVMPGMSGSELARQLRQRRPEIKVILTSGYPKEALELPPLGADTTFVQKPYLPSDLIACLEKLLS